MARGIYKNIKCPKIKLSKFVPQRQQILTKEYFLKSNYKGLLLYHKLGSGKTCTSILIADEMLKRKEIDRVYILSPGSLRKGWIDEYCKVCGIKGKTLKRYYTFVTYNYAVGKDFKVKPKSLIIIDEIHNLINGVKNNSTNPTLIYNKLDQCDSCRILALTGTPIYQEIWEFAMIGRLLNPNEFEDIRKEDSLGNLEINSFTFTKYFKTEKDGEIVPKNKKVVGRKLSGIISFFPGGSKDLYPTIIYKKPLRIVMSEEQESSYFTTAYSEKIRIRIGPPTDKKSPSYQEELQEFLMAVQHINSRATSNVYYGSNTEYSILPDLLDEEKDLDEDFDEDFDFDEDEEDEDEEKSGWISKTNLENGILLEMSRKFATIIMNIVRYPNQKHVVFSFFKKKSGTWLLSSLLKLVGIKSLIFSGDLTDSERSLYLRKFNSPKNRYGEKIPVLFITEAGAEGISIKEARHLHIVESSNKEKRIQQVIGRIARYKSHIELPKDEQNVRIWRYFSVASGNLQSIMINDKKKDIKNFDTIDEILYQKGLIQINKIKTFQNVLETYSIL